MTATFCAILNDPSVHMPTEFTTITLYVLTALLASMLVVGFVFKKEKHLN